MRNRYCDFRLGSAARCRAIQWGAASRSMRFPLLLLATIAASGSARGAECPDGTAGKDGFVLTRPGIRTVVRHAPEHVTVLQNDFGEFMQTQFLVGGLIEVFRSSQKGHVVQLPASDLVKLFPLEQGSERNIAWLRLDAKTGEVEPNAMKLKVGGAESVKLGDCAYDALKIQQVVTDSQGESLDRVTVLYSPELRVILAKRFDEGTADEETVAFEAIEANQE